VIFGGGAMSHHQSSRGFATHVHGLAAKTKARNPESYAGLQNLFSVRLA